VIRDLFASGIPGVKHCRSWNLPRSCAFSLYTSEEDMLRFVSTLTQAAVLVVALLCVGAPANAGTARDQIAKLNAVFTEVMQNAEALGYEGRYAKLEPALVEAYDFAAMTRVTTGRYWRDFTDDQKKQAVEAFRELSIATYAARFDGSAGQRFEILGEEPAPAGGLRVNSQILPPNGEPVRVDYLLRQEDGQWRVMDIYLKSSVSELAMRRDEFTRVLAESGFDGLIADLRAKITQLQS
jgi:phospholipid transport system substrate-binding protein